MFFKTYKSANFTKIHHILPIVAWSLKQFRPVFLDGETTFSIFFFKSESMLEEL